MRLTALLPALLPLALLAACSSLPDRTAVLNSLVGQPETEVVRRFGVPSRTFETGGHNYLAYAEQLSQRIDGGPFFFGGGFYGGGFGYGPGFGYGAAFPTEIVPRVCETTFDVSGGRVVGWALRGNACG